VLKYVPSALAPWKAQVLEQRKKDIEMYTGLMNDVKERMAAGVLPNCFAKHLLNEQHGLGMTDLEIAYTAGSPFGAGVETVRPPCLWLAITTPDADWCTLFSRRAHSPASYLRASSSATASSQRPAQSLTGSSVVTGCLHLTTWLPWSMCEPSFPRRFAGGRWPCWVALRMQPQPMTCTRACLSPRGVPSLPRCGAVSAGQPSRQCFNLSLICSSSSQRL
jgi:hypothetical protein